MMTIAQQDIKSYYDNIDILQIVKFITGKGEHQEAQAISRALLNMHTKTMVSIEVGGAQCDIEGRTSGVLTGTRTAGKMGKIPWLHACQERHAVWEMWSIDVTEEEIGTPDQPQQAGPRKKLGICTWIDNFYCAASTTQAACAIAEDVEAFLKKHWGLEMGADSKKVMPVKSTYRREGDEAPPGWKIVESFPALGHIVAHDASIEECYEQTMEKAWMQLRCNVNKLTQGKLQKRLYMLDVIAKAIVQYRCARWPFKQEVAKRLRMQQIRMIAYCIGRKRRSDQSTDEYLRARMAEAQKFLAGRDWACMWAMSVCNWNEHCQRPRNEKIWSHHILRWRNGEWLDNRRSFYQQQIASYWTVNTRSDQIRPCKRWHEGLETASQFLDHHIDLWNLRLTNHAIYSNTE